MTKKTNTTRLLLGQDERGIHQHGRRERDRLSVEVAQVGEERLGAGDAERERPQRHPSLGAVAREELHGVVRRDGGKRAEGDGGRDDDEVVDADCGEGEAPGDGDRAKERGDAGGAKPLAEEEHGEDAGGEPDDARSCLWENRGEGAREALDWIYESFFRETNEEERERERVSFSSTSKKKTSLSSIPLSFSSSLFLFLSLSPSLTGGNYRHARSQHTVSKDRPHADDDHGLERLFVFEVEKEKIVRKKRQRERNEKKKKKKKLTVCTPGFSISRCLQSFPTFPPAASAAALSLKEVEDEKSEATFGVRGGGGGGGG